MDINIIHTEEKREMECIQDSPTSKLELNDTEEKGKMKPQTERFLQEEQKQRRTEIEKLIDRMEGDQRYGIILTGGMWSWTLTQQDKLVFPLYFFAAFTPLFLMVFFWWRWKNMHKAIADIAAYTRILEERFDLPPDLGWETYLEAKRKNGRAMPIASMERVTNWWWLALILFNSLILIAFSIFKWRSLMVSALLGTC